MAFQRGLTGIALLAATAAGAACAPEARPGVGTEAAGPIRAVYDCRASGTVVAIYTPDSVRIAIGERVWTLPRAITGSGARYTDGRTLIWDRGGNAILEIDGGAPDSCRVRKSAATALRPPIRVRYRNGGTAAARQGEPS